MPRSARYGGSFPRHHPKTIKGITKDLMQDPATGAWSHTLAFDLPFSPVIRPSGWDIAALAPYRKYSKLFGEQKFASNYPLEPFRFLDLPSEIRNQVYRELLVVDPAIELAPKLTKGINNIPRDHHIRRYRKDISPRLRLLRVCKQMQKEGNGIFYGDNKFRFTNSRGWYVLNAFLLTIDLSNIAKIRRLTIHVPWFGSVLDNPTLDGLPESHSTTGWMMRRLDQMGLRYIKWWKQFGMEASVKRCVKEARKYRQARVSPPHPAGLLQLC